jgi:hypothetical protein
MVWAKDDKGIEHSIASVFTSRDKVFLEGNISSNIRHNILKLCDGDWVAMLSPVAAGNCVGICTYEE